MSEPEVTQGQVDNADSTGTTAPAPEASEGQSADPSQTTSGPDTATHGESFFDPKSIEHSPELMQAYKQMQGNFSKKMQNIRDSQQKIEMYDQFMTDPINSMRQVATQYGMTVVDGQPQPTSEGTEFNPKSWDDVVSHIRQEVMAEMNQAYEPLVGQVKDLKKQNIEQYLDAKFIDWRTYEDEMIHNLQKHPSLSNDPDQLYRMSVPQEVLEARATERALAKLKGNANAATVSGSNKATQATSTRPEGKLSFNEAVQYAKDSLRKRGITPIAG